MLMPLTINDLFNRVRQGSAHLARRQTRELILRKTVEESSELITAVCHKKDSYRNKDDAEHELQSEIADSLVMTLQLIASYPEELQRQILFFALGKIDRQNARLTFLDLVDKE